MTIQIGAPVLVEFAIVAATGDDLNARPCYEDTCDFGAFDEMVTIFRDDCDVIWVTGLFNTLRLPVLSDKKGSSRGLDAAISGTGDFVGWACVFKPRMRHIYVEGIMPVGIGQSSLA